MSEAAGIQSTSADRWDRTKEFASSAWNILCVPVTLAGTAVMLYSLTSGPRTVTIYECGEGEATDVPATIFSGDEGYDPLTDPRFLRRRF